MNFLLLIIGSIISCIYFEITFLVIKIAWLRIVLYLLFATAFAFYYKYMLNKKLNALANFGHEIVKGNYSFKPKYISYTGALKEIYTSIYELKNKLLRYIFEMQVAVSQVSSASDQLTVTLDENNNFCRQLYNEAKEIYAFNTDSQNNIVHTLNEVKNIVDLLDSIKNTSEEMHDTSTQSKQIISQSLQEIMEIVHSINDIKNSTDTTVKYMHKLNTATKEISNILQTVDNIAKQTNLLSLNASIESARALEYGKGFGIVASEIRKLSEDSKKAVLDISSLVNNITNEVSNVTRKINDNMVNVQKSVAFSEKIEHSLNKIEESYEDVQSMVENIINLSEEEYKLATNINIKISDTQNLSKEVAEGFDKVYDSVHKQKHNVEELNNLGECLRRASNSLLALTEKVDINLLEINSSKFNSTAQNAIKILKDNLLSSKDILSLDPNLHKLCLDKVLSENSFMEALWTNDHKGRFVYSNPPNGIANASLRNWFKESIKGKEFMSEVYISAITRNPCITVSLPIKDTTGKYIGVLGADIKLRI